MELQRSLILEQCALAIAADVEDRYAPRDDRSLVQARSASRLGRIPLLTLADVLRFLPVCPSRANEEDARARFRWKASFGESRLVPFANAHSLIPRAAMIDLAERRRETESNRRIVHGSRRHSRGEVHGAPVQPHVRQDPV